jgi:hypothetical protein
MNSTTVSLSDAELARLEQLENEQARGEAIRWDEPKEVRGVVVRDVEEITFKDRHTDEAKTKQLLTLRTAHGLVAVFEGPVALNKRLFEGERLNQPSLGPPKTGDLVIIKFVGEGMTDGGQSFKRFEVYRSTLQASAPGEDDIPFQ